MNTAIVLAGGVGSRMHQDLPKQFLSIKDKPIVIYTLIAFQNHPEIDAIAVVCLDGWQEVLKAYAHQFNITKLKAICTQGKTRQESIYNGLKAISGFSHDDDIVLEHDATRPMVSEEIISDCIAICRKYGNAAASIPCTGAMMQNDDEISSIVTIPRQNLKICQTPEAMVYKDFVATHEKALGMGITSSVGTSTLIVETGGRAYYSKGSEKNIKLTTIEDLDMFRALLENHRLEGIKK